MSTTYCVILNAAGKVDEEGEHHKTCLGCVEGDEGVRKDAVLCCKEPTGLCHVCGEK